MSLKRSRLYLAGLFFTSLGSMTYAATLPVLLYQTGVSTAFIGFLIGSMRLNGFLVNSLLGHIGDHFSPRRVIVVSEIGAAAASLLILASWDHWQTGSLIAFSIANHMRVFFTALQTGSTQKMGKHFDTAFSLSGSYAVRVNAATNGALLLGGLAALYFYDLLTVDRIVIFDALTFVANGLLMAFAQKDPDGATGARKPMKVGLNIPSYYKLLPGLATLDVLLSLALCGSNTLNVRLLQNSPNLVPVMPALFGGAAFLTSFGLHKKFSSSSRSIWIVLGLSLLLQGLWTEHPLWVLMASVVRNFAYWILFHAISREVMRSAPPENYAAVASGRSALSTAVLALGEFWVGAAKSISLPIEMAWRFVVTLFPALFWKKRDEK